MDWFQGVVVQYLRADGAVFINTECCVQLNAGANPDTSGPHWYCDAVAVDFRQRAIFLCEISFAKSLASLQTRLVAWAANRPGVNAALVRDCSLPADWPVRPRVFVPDDYSSLLADRLSKALTTEGGESKMPFPLITDLEDVVPWKYPSWNRIGDPALA